MLQQRICTRLAFLLPSCTPGLLPQLGRRIASGVRCMLELDAVRLVLCKLRHRMESMVVEDTLRCSGFRAYQERGLNSGCLRLRQVTHRQEMFFVSAS